MKYRNRALALLLSLVMVLTFMPAIAFAEAEDEAQAPATEAAAEVETPAEAEAPAEAETPAEAEVPADVEEASAKEPKAAQTRGSDEGDSWYIGTDEYTEVTYDPETDDTVTLEAEVVNADDYNLSYKWVSVDYNDDGEPEETTLSGEEDTYITVDANPGEYKFVVTDEENGREEYVTFSVREEAHSGDYDTNVASIEYIPKNPIEIYENTKGYMYEGAYGTEPFWCYNDYNQSYAAEGDEIHVTYKDDTKETFIYQYDFEEECWCYLSGSGNRIYDGDLSVEDDQMKDGGNWTVGEQYFRISYEGVSCNVPIFIVHNNVTRIEYTFVNGLEFVENVDCWEQEDEQGNSYLHYRCEWQEGDVLTVFTEDDPEGKAYTLKEIIRPYGQELWYEAADGSIIKTDDVSVSDNQYEVHWSKEDISNNIVTVTYAGKTFTAYAKLVDQVFEYFDESYDLMLDEPFYIYKEGNEISYRTMDGMDTGYFDVLEVSKTDPEDSRFRIEEGEAYWVVIPEEAGTFSVSIRHTAMNGGEETDTVNITFLEERSSVDVDRTDSTISNRETLPGQSVGLKATGHYQHVFEDGYGGYDGEYLDDDEDTNTGFTYTWEFCDESYETYAVIESPTTRTTKVTIKNLDSEMLNAEVTIAVKAVLYRNGKKLAESEDFEIPISDHYYSIEPETINQYLAPNVRTNFSPKLYKYKYSFSEQKVEKTDCKAKFNLEYDEEYFKVTDINSKPVTGYSAGPFYITRLTADDCRLEITGTGEGTPSIGYEYLFDRVTSIKNAKVKIADAIYDGKVKKPRPSVRVYNDDYEEWETLSSSDYTVTCTSKSVGKATATIKGKGCYYGTVTATFKINPKKAVVSGATPGKAKLTVKAKTKVSSTGGSTYQVWYRVKGSSSWKKKTTTKQTYVIKSLKKGKKYQVKIRAYKKVGSTTYYGAWSAIYISGKVK